MDENGKPTKYMLLEMKTCFPKFIMCLITNAIITQVFYVQIKVEIVKPLK